MPRGQFWQIRLNGKSLELLDQEVVFAILVITSARACSMHLIPN